MGNRGAAPEPEGCRIRGLPVVKKGSGGAVPFRHDAAFTTVQPVGGRSSCPAAELYPPADISYCFAFRSLPIPKERERNGTPSGGRCFDPRDAPASMTADESALVLKILQGRGEGLIAD